MHAQATTAATAAAATTTAAATAQHATGRYCHLCLSHHCPRQNRPPAEGEGRPETHGGGDPHPTRA